MKAMLRTSNPYAGVTTRGCLIWKKLECPQLHYAYA